MEWVEESVLSDVQQKDNSKSEREGLQDGSDISHVEWFEGGGLEMGRTQMVWTCAEDG